MNKFKCLIDFLSQYAEQFMDFLFVFSFLFNQTDQLKYDIHNKVLMSDMEDVFERPTFNQTALKMLLDTVQLVRENTTRAVTSLETILYLIKTPQQHSLKQVLGVSIFVFFSH